MITQLHFHTHYNFTPQKNMKHLYCLWKLTIPCLISQRKTTSLVIIWERIQNDNIFIWSIRDFPNIFRNCSPYERTRWWTKNIVTDIQKHTSKSTIRLKNRYKVDFTIEIHFESFWVSPQKRLKLMGRFTVIISFKYPQA